ncbi:MAG: mannose-6-phosphate isomerase [Hyphomicrobiales bacterium]|nr:MAG: mannose-6-phosphate isomerase [Hyphomicrobiales bacterium]
MPLTAEQTNITNAETIERVPEPISKLSQWVCDHALPFWQTRGRDAVFGGVHERLHWDGSADLASPKRVRVQARQIYCYAHATDLGWFDGIGFAGTTLDWLLEKAGSAGGRPGFAHVLHCDGSVADPLHDTYDHAFMLLALAWYTKATGDSQARGLIGETLAFLDERLLCSDGSYREGLPPSLPRRQNPHMHLLEAMLALHETIAYPGALDRAGRLRAMLTERFLRPSPVLCEFFDDEWRPAADRAGRIVEPGHQAEWCWLLRRYERAAELAPDVLPSTLIDAAEATADPATGFLIDEALSDGTPSRSSRRLWPQTEWVKAWLAEQRIGRRGADVKAAHALTQLSAHYLGQPLPGGWIDQMDEGGRPMVDTIPASTLYHVFAAAVEADATIDAARGHQSRAIRLTSSLIDPTTHPREGM